jgi:hypothetical protein
VADEALVAAEAVQRRAVAMVREWVAATTARADSDETTRALLSELGRVRACMTSL